MESHVGRVDPHLTSMCKELIMDLKLLSSRYCFHDGIVTGIKYLQDAEEVELEIELSNFMQDGYSEADDDISAYRVVFRGVERFAIPDNYLPDDSVLSQKIDGDSFVLVMENSENGDCYELRVKAISADVLNC